MPSIANISVSSSARITTTAVTSSASTTMVSFLPGNDARLTYIVNQVASETSAAAAAAATATSSPSLPTFSPPRIESLVAASAEDLSSFGGDVTFDIFDDDDDLFGSPMAFDASEQGLWNGRFVPPPPRPPFFVDEPVLSDGLTTCDLCSWAMPTKSTFMFEGTIEKANELGWPLTLIIVSVLSALLGAIIMIAVVRCRRKKSSNNRNDTHVQWWSRNKRAHGNGAGTGSTGVGATNAGGSNGAHNNNNSINNNHLRRSNIYTAHPADSIRGLQPLPLPLPLPPPTAATMLSVSPASSQHQQQQHQHQQLQLQQQQPPHYFHTYHHHHHHHQHQHAPPLPHYPLDCDEDAAYEEPEYHQPQQLQQLHSNSNSNSNSLSSVASSPVPTEATTSHWPQASSTLVVAS